MADYNDKQVSNSDKWKISVLSGFLFMLLSSPFLYQMMNSIGGSQVASRLGCPTTLGLFITTVLFVLSVRAMMR